MAVGLQVFDEAGRLMVADNVLSYTLLATGTGLSVTKISGNTTASSILIPIDATLADRFVAIQITNYYAGLVGMATYNGSLHAQYACTGPVGTPFKYFIFKRSSNIAPSTSGYGLEIMDASGNVTYSSNRYAMVCHGILSLAALTHKWSSYYSGPTSQTITGRQLAFAQGSMGGHQIATTMTCYDGNTPTVSPPGGVCSDWRYLNDGKVYGCKISADLQTIQTGSISFDDVMVSNYDNPTPAPDWVQPMQAFVIDVTGIAV